MKNKDLVKKILLVAFFLLFSLGIVEAQPASAQRVGVVGFEGYFHIDFLNRAGDELTRELRKFERFEVAGRREMRSFFQEHEISHHRYLNREQVKEIARSENIDYLFWGKMKEISIYWNSETGRYHAQVNLLVEIIDVFSGEILRTIKGSGSSDNKDRREAQNKAIENCFSSRFMREIREEFLLLSNIKEIDGNEIYFFGGRDLGVKTGQRFMIMERDTERRDGAFYEQIGLLEVSAVSDEISRGRVLYAHKPLSEDNVLQEAVSAGRMKVNVDFRNLPYSKNGEKDRVFGGELKMGLEVPFSFSTGLLFGYTGADGVHIYNFGLEYLREMALSPGRIYLNAGGGLGLSLGATQIENEQYTSVGIFGEVLTGLKYYFRQEHGWTISLDGFARYGSSLRHWQRDSDDVWVDYGPEVHLRGFGLRISLGLGF